MNTKSSVNFASKKHLRDSENESDENDEIDPGTFAQMTRSQRKCHRERRRRSEVNKGFDDLTSLLWDIDSTTMRAEVENRAQRGKKQSNLPTEDILLSRVDLINFTISLLRRLHAENEQRKEIIATLTRAGAGTFDAGVNLALPNLGNVTAPQDSDRARMAAAEVRSLYPGVISYPVACNQHKNSTSSTTLQRLLLGMMSPSNSSFQGGPLGLPSAPLESQHIFQQQSLLDQLVRTQPDNSGVLTRSIQDMFSNIYSPQSDMGSNRKEADDLSTLNMRIPSAVGDGGSIIPGSTSNASALLRSPSNSDVVASFLARQQNNRNISKYINNNSNSFTNNLVAGESSSMSLRNAQPTPAGVAPTDTTRQLLQLMQNRQTHSTNNANLAQIEVLLQQQLQRKPQGR
jgi:Helix-loop-helix DNA-binding domain